MDILGDRGQRYKRNVLLISVTISLVEWVPGISITDVSAFGFETESVPARYVYGLAFSLLFYHFIYYALHIRADWEPENIPSLETKARKNLRIIYGGWEARGESRYMISVTTDRHGTVKVFATQHTFQDGRWVSASQSSEHTPANLRAVREKLTLFVLLELALPISVMLLATYYMATGFFSS